MTEPTRETTRDRLILLVDQEPTLSTRDLAERLGVSHIRVHQILTDMGYQNTYQRISTWTRPSPPPGAPPGG